jgi:hypothetical protein
MYETVNERLTKVPYDAKNGRKADSTKPSTWASFDQAIRSLRKYPKYDGIGFVFSKDDPYTGVDLDHCIDPELLSWAREIVQSMDTYTEITPSGSGLHLICKGELPPGRNRKGAIEMYSKGRYFTMTGQMFEGHGTISEGQAELEGLFRKVFSEDKPTAQTPAQPQPRVLGGSEIIEQARNAKNGAKFSQLWAGDTSGYPSQSEADQALCNMLAFWCGRDPAQMDSLFRQSGLHREKWERADYRDWTIDKAIEQCTEVYEPGAQMPGTILKPTEETWPEPKPIHTALQSVEPMPAAIIPEPFRGWLSDIAHRMTCPLDFPTVAAIIGTGAIIGAGCGIRPKRNDNWQVISNLWGGVVARPGKAKSPALDEGMKSINMLESEAKGAYDQALADWEADNEAYKAKKEAIKGDMAAAAKGKGKKGEKVPDMAEAKAEYLALGVPETPARRRYKTSDSTIEKMAVLLNENPRGILMFKDELVGFLVSLDREDRQADRAFYLSAWNGYGQYTTDRIGRGTIDTPNLCVSVLGGIQPSKLTGYLLQARDDLKNDGLLQRFQLLVYPDEVDWKLIDEHPNIEARDRVYGIFKTLADMDFTQCGAELPDGEKIPFFHFSDEAQQVFYDWLTDLEATKINGEDNPLMAEHLSKYRSLMPSLALIFHLIAVADGQPGGPVTETAAMQAAAWCDYLESHARRIYGLLVDVSVRSAEELSKRLTGKDLQDGFTLYEVYHNGWHLLDRKELAQGAVDELLDAEWLREDFQEIPGRQPKAIYRINPKIFPANA